jgi:hypothetical protein
MLSSIERLPANPAREDEPEPERCMSCGRELDGSYCPDHCGVGIDVDAMLSDMEACIYRKLQEMQTERAPGYRLSLWRQIRDTHGEIQKLWKELCK